MSAAISSSANGMRGVNFHSGGYGPGYTPIADNGGAVVDVRPEFYGMLLFSQATPLVEQAFKLIVRTARQSETVRARLDDSVSRILLLKTRIQYSPPRYHAHIRTRIHRQIEKLRSEVGAARTTGKTPLLT